MRHANGLEEVQAQMLRHFLPQPVLGAADGQQAQRAQQAQQQQPAGGERRPPAGQQTREQQLARLAAGQAALVTAFESAEAEGRDPVAAVHAAAEAAKANASRGSAPAAEGSRAPAPEAEKAQQAQQGQQGQQQGEPHEQRQFRAFTYLSQLQQGLAYQAAIHQWRRNKADRQARVRLHGGLEAWMRSHVRAALAHLQLLPS